MTVLTSIDSVSFNADTTTPETTNVRTIIPRLLPKMWASYKLNASGIPIRMSGANINTTGASWTSSIWMKIPFASAMGDTNYSVNLNVYSGSNEIYFAKCAEKTTGYFHVDIWHWDSTANKFVQLTTTTMPAAVSNIRLDVHVFGEQ